MVDKKGFNTQAIHGGYHVDSGPVNAPIDESSTHGFESCEDGAKRFASQEKEGIYARLSNPTVRALEKKVAILENGYCSVATASGMAAVSVIYFNFLHSGAHAIATSSMYGPSRSILEKEEFYGKWGIESTLLDTSNADEVRNAINPDTALIYIETPANPTLAVTDIAKIAEIAGEGEIPLVVDNTFCSPYLQNPLGFGADVVIHSMTKSIGGHANAVGGIIVTRTEEDYWPLRNTVVNLGGTLAPHEANLFNTGVKTLPIRMEKMQANMQTLVDYLRDNSKVDWVIYPDEQHSAYEVIKKQMRGPGSLTSFGVKDGYEAAKTLLNNLNIITLAVSLGGVESLIQHPASMTHAGILKEKRDAAGITNDLVRFSAGIENVDDLLVDLEQAFEKI